jgi:hypothetical protein
MKSHYLDHNIIQEIKASQAIGRKMRQLYFWSNCIVVFIWLLSLAALMIKGMWHG